MNESKEIKDKFVNPALAASDLAAIERASAIWKCAVEAEKSEAESAKAKIESAKFRFWVPALAPFVGALVLAATVWVQFQQYNANTTAQLVAEKAKEEEYENEQLQSALQTAKMPGAVSALAGMTLLKSRLNSKVPSQQQQAREIAISLLGASSNPDGHALLFPALFSQPEWSYLGDAVRLSRMLKETWDRESSDLDSNQSKLKEIQNTLEDPVRQPPSPNPPYTPREQSLEATLRGTRQNLSRAENPEIAKLEEEMGHLQDDMNQLYPQSSSVSEYIGRCLRLPGRPAVIDLKNAMLNAADFSAVDFDGVDLSDASVQNLSVKDALLTGVSKFEGSNWYGTAWWRAHAISPPLLRYLQINYPYHKKTPYFSDTTHSLGEYLAEIKRLEMAAGLQASLKSSE